MDERDVSSATKATQRQRVMRHLRKYGTLTSLEAITLYGIMRLSSRISELRTRGEQIETVMKKGFNKFGEPMRYAEYCLKDNKEATTWKKGSLSRSTSTRKAGSLSAGAYGTTKAARRR